MTRRTAIGVMAGAPAAAQMAAPLQSANVSLDWLDQQPPALPTGVSWGVPWPRGTVRKGQEFALTSAGGKALPLQTWPLAYWPDGSIKWSGLATVAGPEASAPLRLTPGHSTASALHVTETADAIEVDTGRLKCRIPRRGQNLIESMTIEGREVARQGRLICTLEDRSRDRILSYEDFASEIKKVTAEQSGPVRGVVRIDGVHKSSAREWLPFTVRLYFYAGQEPVRLVHSIVFDGDEHKDFISGLGVSFVVPMREQVHNRHVRFSGEGDGLWAEPLQPLTGRRSLAANVFADQLAGKRIPNRETFNAQGQGLMHDWAVWDDFKLVQASADGFTVHKRTNPESCWLEAGAGRRASGLAFVGDVSGGLGVALKNFWQSYPASLEIRRGTSDAAELRVWLWSPDAPAMDLRHYDTKAHGLEAAYEDVQPGFSTPNGVGRTSELMLFPSASLPSREDTAKQAKLASHPPLLAAAPDYLHSTKVFGLWSLPDRSTPAKRWVEDQLDAAFAFYQKEVEQRHWYGFWNYGDIMHTYDTPRHVWRYDVGGMAWDNSELVPDMWLWYSFLRTGRADIFRMAEAMTRHTGEVDTYHSGRFAMLGSRHNVRHWGCGAKEVRISQAALRRFHHYLTTDERAGDIMRDQVDADHKLMEIDPMRLAVPASEMPSKYPARVRGGPDWLAFVGNWMTEWERTGDTKYRDKIIAGMDSIAAMPYGFLSGPNSLFGYDPSTGKLYTLADDPFGSYNLTLIMGGAEVVFELNELIDHAGWHKAWLQYCRLLGAPKDVVKRDMTTGTEDAGVRNAGAGTGAGARLPAYSYWKLKDPKYAERAWNGVLGRRPQSMFPTRKVEGADVLSPIEEIQGLSTNSVAQWCLNAIEVMEMCGDRAPAA